MKKIIVVILLVAMLALSVVPAFAAGGPPADRGKSSGNCTGIQAGAAVRRQVNPGLGNQAGFGLRTPYALSGTISAINQNDHTITVTVVCGNRIANAFIESDVTLKLTDGTRFLLRNEDGSGTPITFTDLKIGATVSSHGSLVNGIWTATRVIMGALLTCLH